MAAVHQGWWFSARLDRSLWSRLGFEVFGSSRDETLEAGDAIRQAGDAIRSAGETIRSAGDTIRQDIFLFRISDTIWRPF